MHSTHGRLEIEKPGKQDNMAEISLINVTGSTVMILSFRTDRSEQTVQTQIRLLLEEQSDLGLHCLPFHLHLLYTLLYGITFLFEFTGIASNFSVSENLGILWYQFAIV